VNFECKLRQIVRVGEGPLAGNVVFGTIVLMHVAERVLDSKGRIDPAKLDTIGRMGGDWYARTSDRFVLERPGR
jgi:flavin reductase (DIM6/NTAB) family NADH-FMN oxidoreductase RutF